MLQILTTQKYYTEKTKETNFKTNSKPPGSLYFNGNIPYITTGTTDLELNEIKINGANIVIL